MLRRLSIIFITIATLNPQVGWAMNAEEYRLLGISYQEQEKYSEAIDVMQKAVKLQPKNIDGRVLLGWTQHLDGQEDAATKTLVETFYLDSFYVPNLNALGIVHLVSGRLYEAAATHIWAIVLKHDDEIAYYNLSLTMERLKKYPWAIGNAKRASQLEPNNPHPLVALAIAHWGQGDRTQAKKAFRQAIALDRRYRNTEFLNHLKKAGFSPAQIQTSKQILQNIKLK